jgi:hypothetical protein
MPTRNKRLQTADTITRPGTPTDTSPGSYYEDLLNRPLFDVPANLGHPGESDQGFPTDELGGPDMDKNNLPPEVSDAAQAVAEVIVVEAIKSIFGDVENAYNSLWDYCNGKSSDNPFIKNAVSWINENLSEAQRAEVDARKKSDGEDDEESPDMQKSDKSSDNKSEEPEGPMPKRPFDKDKPGDKKETSAKVSASVPNPGSGKTDTAPSTSRPGDVAPEYAPTDGEEFTKNAPAPHYSPPGDKLGGPAGNGMELETITKNSPHETFHPHDAPGGLGKDKAPQDEYSFPGSAPHPSYSPPGEEADAGDRVKVQPGNPEYDRHNPDTQETNMYCEKEPSAPWESAYSLSPTPGMEHIFGEDDGHVGAVELASQKVDLYYKRFMKRGDVKDLRTQADRFREERDAMGAMVECGNHTDQHNSYAKQLFAFSYGQVRRSFHRALRQFTDMSDPDENVFVELTAMRADLMGESTKRFLGAAQELPIQLANFVGVAAGGDSSKEDDSDEDDMKENDVSEAVSIALVMHGVEGSSEQLANTIVKLAKLTPELRKDFLEIATTGRPVVQAASATTSSAYRPGAPRQPNAASLEVANKNLAPTKHQPVPGSEKDPRQTGAGVLGMFNKVQRAAINS